MFDNVLVCLDGSKISEAILTPALELSERFGSKVTLLNVIVVPGFPGVIGKAELDTTQRTQSPQMEEADCYLEGIAQIFIDKGIDVETVTVEGTVEESIITCAGTYQIDLIAIASRDRSFLSRLFLENIAGYIIRKSGIPVLTICPTRPDS